ncbi:hypothetical protein Cni_G14484 [Canna indica]|uniref:RING-CH-type domain-containing protein n=1 Tax=Canna indica TaxID=4628 RepID=A0AAQ3KF33_9LILI|nr:hypothetical protein Cni_G14484 [Canna indica]
MPYDEVNQMETKLPVSELEPNNNSGQTHIPMHDSSGLCGREKLEACETSQEMHLKGSISPTITIRVSQPADVQKPNMGNQMSGVSEADLELGESTSRKSFLPKSESYREQCRVCQQQAEEPLMDLGCKCKGELAKAHRSCIQLWFYTKGSNKCEICQQVATNVPFSESTATISNWVGRTNSAYGIGQGNERGFFSPLLVAFVILLGGLLLDVLISVSLGVTALPLNIIIGVLIVLGLGIGFRLAQECWQSWRNPEMADVNINPGYQNTV